MFEKVTFALTSCGRPDLLEQTLDSFFEYNTYPIERYIITDDSCIPNINNKLKDKYSKYNILWIDNTKRLGQIKSVDNMYGMINTDYIFHCEEDWLFTKSSFIEKSLDILSSHNRILNVHLRDINDLNGHPVEDITYSVHNTKYKYLCLDYMNIWNGFSFNPGLRRLYDYNLIKPFNNIGHEASISITYKNLGYRAVVLIDKYVEHIGWNRHVKDINEL